MTQKRRSKGSVNAQGEKDGGRFAPGEKAKEQEITELYIADFLFEQGKAQNQAIQEWLASSQHFFYASDGGWRRWLDSDNNLKRAYNEAEYTSYDVRGMSDYLDSFGVANDADMPVLEAQKRLYATFREVNGGPPNIENQLEQLAQAGGDRKLTPTGQPPDAFWEEYEELKEEYEQNGGEVAPDDLLQTYIDHNEAGIVAGWVMFYQSDSYRKRNPQLVKASQDWVSAAADDMVERNTGATHVLVDTMMSDNQILERLGKDSVNELCSAFSTATERDNTDYLSSVPRWKKEIVTSLKATLSNR